MLIHWCPQLIHVIAGFDPHCPEGFGQNGYITRTGGWQRVKKFFSLSHVNSKTYNTLISFVQCLTTPYQGKPQLNRGSHTCIGLSTTFISLSSLTLRKNLSNTYDLMQKKCNGLFFLQGCGIRHQTLKFKIYGYLLVIRQKQQKSALSIRSCL